MAPFKSEAQKRRCAELVKQGKMKKEEFDKWNAETGNKPLPERVHWPELPKASTVKIHKPLRIPK